MILFGYVSFALWKEHPQFFDHRCSVFNIETELWLTIDKTERKPLSLCTPLPRRQTEQSHSIHPASALNFLWHQCLRLVLSWVLCRKFERKKMLRWFGSKQEISSRRNCGEQYLKKPLKVLAAEELINRTTLKLRGFTHQKNPVGNNQTSSHCEKTLQCIFNQ